MKWDTHIGFFCSSVSWGGLEMNVARFAKQFKDRGQKVSVFSVAGSPLFEKHKANGFDVIPIKHHRKYFDTKNILKWSSLIKTHGINFIWIRDTRDIQISGLANKLAGNKSKIIYQQAMQLGVKKKDIFHTMRFNRLDAWISPLQFLADQVMEKTNLKKERIKVIPLGVDAGKFLNLPDSFAAREALKLPQKDIVIGLVGRIDPLKGQLFLFEVFERVAARHEHIHLLFVGEPTRNESSAYYSDLKKSVELSDYAKRIHFKPFMKDLTRVYAACDIAVMASEGETFGMVTIEAMMCGLPVLGTSSSGTPEILGYGKEGKLFAPGNHNEAEESLDFLITNPIERRKLGMKAQKKALQKFALHKVMEQLDQLLLDL